MPQVPPRMPKEEEDEVGSHSTEGSRSHEDADDLEDDEAEDDSEPELDPDPVAAEEAKKEGNEYDIRSFSALNLRLLIVSFV